MGKLTENKRKKREAILNASYELFTSEGINMTSISQITSKAGLAKGTFYLYFKDKYEIQRELIRVKAASLFEMVQLQIGDIKGKSLEQVVNRLVNLIIDEFEKDKSLLIFIAKNLNWGLFQKVVLKGEDELSESFIEWYEKLLENSGRKFKNRDLMIYLIVELLNSSCYNVILHSEPVGVEELKEELNQIIPIIIKNQEISA